MTTFEFPRCVYLFIVHCAQTRDLLRRGADSSFQEEEEGRSALMLAAEKGHMDVVVVLLERGAPWNALDRRGKCAGQYAFQNEHVDVANRIRTYHAAGLGKRKTFELCICSKQALWSEGVVGTDSACVVEQQQCPSLYGVLPLRSCCAVRAFLLCVSDGMCSECWRFCRADLRGG